MKKKRLKKKPIIIICIFLFLLGLLISPYFFVNIKLIGDKKLLLNYKEKYSEPGYRGTLFSDNITSKIKVRGKVGIKEGTYKIKYSYQFLFYNISSTRTVIVKDIKGPKIVLNEGNSYDLTINEEYKEPGYTATDNKDGDVTDKVKVTGKIDNKKLGSYELIYEVKDTSNNKTKVIRKVNVVKKKPSQMSLTEYSLDGWFNEIQLKETKNYGDDYFNSIVMVGDSNTMQMYLRGVLQANNAWAVPCLHAEAMNTTNINLYGTKEEMLLIDAVKKYKPEKMILNFGSFSSSWINEEAFLNNAKKVIENIKKESPKTKLMLISIYPVTKDGRREDSFDQKTINKYNYLILELASKYELKYLDVQRVLKDDTGYANVNYYLTDGFHLTTYGYNVVKEYIKTHAWED